MDRRIWFWYALALENLSAHAVLRDAEPKSPRLHSWGVLTETKFFDGTPSDLTDVLKKYEVSYVPGECLGKASFLMLPPVTLLTSLKILKFRTFLGSALGNQVF